MAIKTIWVCDGCGLSQDITGKSHKSDWREIGVTLEGFGGYPTGDWVNGSRSYILCPACQRHLADNARPETWPRAESEAA